MDFSKALEWVEENKEIARNWYFKFGAFSPYDIEDFHSVVMEAALIAFMKTEEVGPDFEAIFVRTLQRRMGTLIPGYGEDRSESNRHKGGSPSFTSTSISSHLCDDLDECAGGIIISEETKNPAFTAEHAFDLVKPHLKAKQQQVLFHTLGLSEKGELSLREIEEITGISKSAAGRQLANVFDTVAEKVKSGVIRPFSPISFTTSDHFHGNA